MDRRDAKKQARRAKEQQVTVGQRAFDALLEEWQPRFDDQLTTR